MNKEKSVVISLLIFILCGVFICGCGAYSNEPDSPQVTLKFMWWGGQERYEQTLAVIEAYETEHPEIDIEPESVEWNEYFDRLSAYAATGTMPDIVQMDYMYIFTYTQNGALADLKRYVAEGIIDVSDIDGSLIRTGIMSGKEIGIPVSTSMLSVVYSKKVFDEAKLNYPRCGWTWDEFIEICEEITDRTGKTGAAMTPIADVNIYNYFVRQHGMSLFDNTNKSLGTDGYDILVDYINIWKELIDEGALTEPSEYERLLSESAEQMPVVLDEAGLMFEWSNFINKVSDANDELGIVTPPLLDKNNGSKGLWNKPGMFLSIAETSKEKEEAAKFIDWFINSDEANAIMLGERGIPANMNIRKTLLESNMLTNGQKQSFEYTDVAYDYIGDIMSPDPAGISEINSLFRSLLEKAFYNQLTPVAAAEQFDIKANKILREDN